MCYITEWINNGNRARTAQFDIWGAGRPDQTRDSCPAGSGRGHGDGAGETVRYEFAGRFQAFEGAGTGGIDQPGEGGAVEASTAGAGACRRGAKLDRFASSELGRIVFPSRRLVAGATFREWNLG